MDDSSDNRKKLIAGLAVLIVIVVIVAAATLVSKKNSDTSVKDNGATSSHASGDTTANNTATLDSNATYNDGTYSSTANFSTPGGLDAIAVTMTINDNTVTAVSSTTNAPDSESEEHDSAFLADYKQFVEGKSVNSISISRVSGASLTTQGFNDALEKIAEQAKV